MGLVSFKGTPTYQQGVHKSWRRRDRFDFYWPILAHIGEQPVYNYELFSQGNYSEDNPAAGSDGDVFGYQEAWAEYRYGTHLITGHMRSGVTNSYDLWHLSQQLTNPTSSSTPDVDKPKAKLDSDFLVEAPPPGS